MENIKSINIDERSTTYSCPEKLLTYNAVERSLHCFLKSGTYLSSSLMLPFKKTPYCIPCFQMLRRRARYSSTICILKMEWFINTVHEHISCSQYTRPNTSNCDSLLSMRAIIISIYHLLPGPISTWRHGLVGQYQLPSSHPRPPIQQPAIRR